MYKFIDLSEVLEQDTEYIPLLSPEDDDLLMQEPFPTELPILPLKNTVLFPGVVIPITVGREKSIRLIQNVQQNKMSIGVVAQKDKDHEDPGLEDLYKVGTIAHILKAIQMSDGNITIIIQGRRRFNLDSLVATTPYLTARVSPREELDIHQVSEGFQNKLSLCRMAAMDYVSVLPNVQNDTALAIRNISGEKFLLDFIASMINTTIEEKQRILEINTLDEKVDYLLDVLNKEISLQEVNKQIQNKVQSELTKQQREFLLTQQLKKIQEELGEPTNEDIQELQDRAKEKKWDERVAKVFDKEMQKLQRLHTMSPDYSTQLNYLSTIIDLPWDQYTEDNFDLKHAKQVLDADHFGLENVKERIIEHMAVLKLKGDMKSPIICLVGPPGVGKTSLGKSIATALGRKYIRISLGGLRDESEIRGHRRTYIGAMPGRIIQNLKKAESSNPVFVLDEIDKVMGMNVSGDPSAALLEVLDPEQNTTFHDNFLDIDYDLSKVLFIATANSLAPIYPALLDRMEVIDISGYILEEKREIAKRHLVPKQIKEHGLKPNQLVFPDEVIVEIIQNYTRESGVRKLEKQIAKMIRSKARLIAEGDKVSKKLTIADVHKILGIPVFDHSKSLKEDTAGVVTGLAWTAVGGEILFIESSLSPGKGSLTLTGNLGDVMKESAALAYEYLKAHAEQLKIDPKMFEKWNVHVHVPEGATPKDGPSAGVAMFTALVSAFTNKKVRSDYAMTGEITLRGAVLPVGGIKEKILAAKRADIKHIILCKENRKNIEEIEQSYLGGITFHYVDNMLDVIKLALK